MGHGNGGRRRGCRGRAGSRRVRGRRGLGRVPGHGLSDQLAQAARRRRPRQAEPPEPRPLLAAPELVRLMQVVETRGGVRLRRPVNQLLDGKVAGCDEVVARVLVVINNGKRKRVQLLVRQHLEYHLLVEHGVQVVPDAPRAVRLLAQGRHHKGVHVEARPREVVLRREVGDVADLEEYDAQHIGVAAELVGVLLPPSPEPPKAQSALPPLDGLGLRRVLGVLLLLVIVVIVIVVVVVGGPLPADAGWGDERRPEPRAPADPVVGGHDRGDVPRRRVGYGRDEGVELFKDVLGGRVGARRIVERELELHLARDDARLLAGLLAPQGVPFRLLHGVRVGEDVLEAEVELAHVVLAEAILVPAYDVEQQALDRVHGELLDGVPFWVERLGDGVRDGLCVAEVEDEILRGGVSCRSAGPSFRRARDRRAGIR